MEKLEKLGSTIQKQHQREMHETMKSQKSITVVGGYLSTRDL